MGFGDYHPKSDSERLVCLFILMFGVAIFSYIMGNFIQIVEQIREFKQEIDEGDELTKFFGLIQRFNHGKPINQQLMLKIQEYFQKRWQNDRSVGFQDPNDIALFEQLPEWVQNTLFESFVYKQFLEKFYQFFQFRRNYDDFFELHNNDFEELRSNGHVYEYTNKRTFGQEFDKKRVFLNYHANTFFTWNDTQYRDFMMSMLIKLEPRYEPENTILVDELDEMTEIIFVYEGTINVGYEINKQKKFCLKYTNYCVIGSYGINFDQRACFIYATTDKMLGYSIRKANWHELMEQNPEIQFYMKRNALIQYMTEIRSKVMVHKKRAINDFKRRNDHQMIAISEFKSDLTNIAQLKSVFTRYFSPQKEVIENDADKLEQDTMIHKFSEYEHQVKQLLKDIEDREDSIGELDEIIHEQDEMIQGFDEQIKMLEDELKHLENQTKA